jgi:site-specific recombinase XerD
MGTRSTLPSGRGIAVGGPTPLTQHALAYRTYLLARGHAAKYVRTCEAAVAHLWAWMARNHRPASDLSESLVTEFLDDHLPRCRCATGTRDRRTVRAALGHLLTALRASGVVAAKALDTTAAADELRRLDEHLAQVRGLAASTRANVVRIVARLLRQRFGSGAITLHALTPEHVREFFAEQAKRYTTPVSLGTVVSSLRGYFRWRSMLGDPTAALAGVLSAPANWQQASLPQSLVPDEVDRLVAALGQPGPSMRRSDAMVRCALDLGLRIGEIARLSLDDIDWAAGTITLRRTKGRRDDVMPLPATTGQAIAAYLRHERPKTVHRMVFATHKTPRERPIGAEVVGMAVRQAYKRAGLACTRPHLLRHTMAGRLLAGGSPIKEVADVLRHRSLSSTQIYAKLDVNQLLEVALPWPAAPAPSNAGRSA